MMKGEGGMSEEETARRTRSVLQSHQRLQRRWEKSTANDEEAYRRLRSSPEYKRIREQIFKELG